MKKLYMLLCLLMGSSLMAMEDSVEPVSTRLGWHFTNTTQSPVTLSWYKSSISRAYRSSWGPKAQIPGYRCENIQPNDTAFIEMPPRQVAEGWLGSSMRRELLLSYKADALTPLVDADKSGKITDKVKCKSIVVVTKHTLPLTDGITIPEVSLVQPLGTTDLKVVSDAFPLTGTFWMFENVSSEPVYCSWYEAPWDYQKKAYLNPERMEKQTIITIDPHTSASVLFPDKQKNPAQRQLLISYDQDLLTQVVMQDDEGKLPHGVIGRNQHDLKPYNSLWRIYDEEGVPYTSPLSYLISVINTTNKPLYAAMYYVKNGVGTKFGPRDLVTELAPQLSAHIQYPPKVKGSSIHLVVTADKDKELLKRSKLSLADIRKLVTKNFSSTNVVNWYFEGTYAILTDVRKDGAYNFKLSSVGGGAVERIPRKLFDIKTFDPTDLNMLEARFRDKATLFVPNQEIVEAAEGQSIEVMTKQSQLEKEQEYVRQRSEVSRNAINRLFGGEIIAKGQKVPKIALVFTGGGYRAMIETIGFLRGAGKAGILDCATYMTGLSGSTWAINPWVASGLSIQEFSDEQRLKVGRGGSALTSLRVLQSEVIANPQYVQRRFIESRFGQFHGPIGLYGHALANALLDGITVNGKTAHDITLSDLRTNLVGNRYPLPISVAVDPGKDKLGADRMWYEFSPFYAGTKQELGSWVDSKLFGSTFKGGVVQHVVPEYPLAQYMGILGSAFALSSDDIAKNSALGGYLSGAAATLGSGISTLYNLALWRETVPSEGSGRTAVGQMPNPSFMASKAPRLQKNPYLSLIDGGIVKQTIYRHNFATIPALWRDVDILIMCDAIGNSGTDEKSKHLVGAAEEAFGLGYPFPSLHRGSIHQATLSKIPEEVSTLIVEDKTPVIVYMKGQKNDKYAENNLHKAGFDPDENIAKFTATLNFNYTPEQFDVLTGLTEHIMSDEKTVANVKEAIREVQRRNKK